MDLYYLKYKGEEYYFFQRSDGEMIQLTKKSSKITEGNKVREDNRYKGVLSYIFKNYPPLSDKSIKADFDRRTMIEYTKEYHEMTCDTGESCIIFTNDYKKSFIDFDLNLYTGLEVNNLQIIMLDNLVNNMHSISPVVGIEAGFTIPRYFKPLHFIIGTNISKTKFRDDFVNSYKSSYNKYFYDALKLDSYLGLKYQFYKKKLKPNLKVSYGFLSMIDQKATLYEEFYQHGEHISTTNPGQILNNYMQGIKFGGGILYPMKNIDISLDLMYSYYQIPFNFKASINNFGMRIGVIIL